MQGERDKRNSQVSSLKGPRDDEAMEKSRVFVPGSRYCRDIFMGRDFYLEDKPSPPPPPTPTYVILVL